MRDKRTIPAVCQQCGCNFLAFKNSRGQFCSRQCAGMYRAALPKPHDAVVARFWAKVEKTASCWLWTATTVTGGYGMFRYQDRNQLAHRIAYELTYGPIPDGLLVCHHCDTPACCRPDHLFLGTTRENAADMVRKGRTGPRQGEHNGRALLNAAQVRAIRTQHATGVARSELARQFGVRPGTINSIIQGRNWKHI